MGKERVEGQVLSLLFLWAAGTAIARAGAATTVAGAGSAGALLSVDFLVEGLLHLLNHLTDSFTVLHRFTKVLLGLGCLDTVLQSRHVLIFTLITV